MNPESGAVLIAGSRFACMVCAPTRLDPGKQEGSPMTDPTRTPSSWRTVPPRAAAPGPARSCSAPRDEHDRGDRDERRPDTELTFRDLAAIQIAAAIKGTSRDLSPRETAEIAFDLATALEAEREERYLLRP
jgi:hypothetical protein